MYHLVIQATTVCGVVLGTTGLGTLALLAGMGGTAGSTTSASGFFSLPGLLNPLKLFPFFSLHFLIFNPLKPPAGIDRFSPFSKGELEGVLVLIL